MGLDVTVFKNIKKVEHDDYDFIAYVDHPDWKGHIKNLEEGAKYVGDRLATDIHYGYGGHHWFRDLLMSLVLDRKVEDFSDEIEDNLDIAFIELINFSDCEGCIDWETSAKLYQDFVDWEERARNEFPVDGPALQANKMFIMRYENWMEAFEMGKDNAVVVY